MLLDLYFLFWDQGAVTVYVPWDIPHSPQHQAIMAQ